LGIRAIRVTVIGKGYNPSYLAELHDRTCDISMACLMIVRGSHENCLNACGPGLRMRADSDPFIMEGESMPGNGNEVPTRFALK
jgi:hypothetical protein